jgi:hypothetical protein
LGEWIKRIREAYRRCLKKPTLLGDESPGIILGPNKLSTLRIDQLEAMGLQWSVDSLTSTDDTPSFEDRIVELREYYDEHGHLLVPEGWMGGRSKNLGFWTKRIRDSYQKCRKKPTLLGDESPGIVLATYKLSKLRIKRLDAMGFTFSIKPRWEERFQDLVEFKVRKFSALLIAAIAIQ